VALAVVLFRGLPVVETELDTAVLVIIELEDVVGCAVVVLSGFRSRSYSNRGDSM